MKSKRQQNVLIETMGIPEVTEPPALPLNTGLASANAGRHRVIELPTQPRRAYDILANQPVSLLGLSTLERSLVVVAAVADEQGSEHVVTRVGDAVWDLRSLEWPPNASHYLKYVTWPDDVPKPLLHDTQNVFYAWLKRGKPGGKPVAAATFCEALKRNITTLRYLAARGVTRFSQVTSTDIADLHSYLKHEPFDEVEEVEGVKATRVIRSPVTVRQYMEVLNLVFVFSSDVEYPLQFDPWDGENFSRFFGVHGPGSAGKTAVMPRRVVEGMFTYCEAVLSRAPTLLDLWEAGRIDEIVTLTSVDKSLSYVNCWQAAFNRVCEIRDAVLFMLEISTGMRNSEAVGVKNGAWRVEADKSSGISYHWVTTTELKTGKGRCDYLAPPELISALNILQRWAKPHQTQLNREVERLQTLLAGSDGEMVSESLTRVEALQRLKSAKDYASNLFLAVSKKNRVNVVSPGMSFASCNDALVRLAKAAKVNWSPRNHECRRTFAWTVANSRIGRFALIFLKWQLKHSTMSMTQLYASNPHQSQELYDEIYEAVVLAQTEVILECFDEDEGVAGGLGGTIRAMRNRELRGIAVRDKSALILHTAQTETLRNNGHAYCMAEKRDCGGNGLFDAGWCVDCDESLIKSKEHFTFWWNWLVLSRRLFDVADCGEGARERAQKDIAYAEKVFTELGHPLPPPDAEFIDYDEAPEILT